MVGKTIIYSSFLIYLTVQFCCLAFKLLYIPDGYKGRMKEVYPARNTVCILYAAQLFGISYLWNIGNTTSLLYVNSLLVVSYSALLGYMSDKYYLGRHKGAKKAFLYYLPGLLVLVPLFIESTFSIKFMPNWLAAVLVALVAGIYLIYELHIALEIGKKVSAYTRGDFSNLEDFPYKTARRVQWIPLIMGIGSIMVMLLNNIWLNVVRDMFLSYLTIAFTIYTLAPHRKGETEDVMTHGEEVEQSSSKHLMSERKFLELKEDLERLLTQDKIYLDPHIKSEDLQRMLGTNRSYVYELINRCEYGSFFEMINRCRINAAVEMIRENPGILLADVADDCGFPNASAMTKSFKMFYGAVPSKVAQDAAKNAKK